MVLKLELSPTCLVEKLDHMMGTRVSSCFLFLKACLLNFTPKLTLKKCQEEVDGETHFTPYFTNVRAAPTHCYFWQILSDLLF